MEFKDKILREPLVDKPLAGTLFLPHTQGKLPGVVVIPGSDGGIPETIAKSIASYGYAVLALGYFGFEGLPPYLENINLEYFKKAIEWFKSRVDMTSLALLGYSRGGELALLLGSIFPKLIDSIIAYEPSCFVSGGFPHPNRPAWLLNNQPVLPYVKGRMSREEDLSEAEDLFLACQEGIIPFHENTSKDPYEIVDLFLARQKSQQGVSSAVIPVENIACPLLVISGGQDKIWPSSFYAKEIRNRLIEKKSDIQREFLNYQNAGHGIIFPFEGSIYHPVGKFWCTLGGTSNGNKQACEDAWKATLEFLSEMEKNH